ncbi:MAG: hypothetical protein COV67_04535 [Nitrospinae bacterium CG11_big_fil_rev_8_21_14_0_20_56_8]|nr:MAG: hypothetical protein COV67_04535 [Nitrospinae bacterium CG11_big_fil_rev_8_21_14_0_20_56_8]
MEDSPDLDDVHSTIKGEVEEKRGKWGKRISFWGSFVLATAVTFWYYTHTPPDTEEMKQMRLFFKNNANEVMSFVNLPHEEMVERAKKMDHPFYKTFPRKTAIERDKIRALVHISTDYTPNQYWFNIVSLWLIAFTTLWFLGLMIEASLIIVQKEREDRLRKLHLEGKGRQK